MPVATLTAPEPATRSAPATPIGALPFLLALAAFIPAIAAAIRAWTHGLIPTGFVQYDMPCYLAQARQHFAGGFHLTYANPYGDYGGPRIYFQPHILVLAFLERLPLDPGLVYLLFGIAMAAFAAWAAARFYREVVGWNTTAQKIGFVIFFWGGGVLAIAGLIFGLPAGNSFSRSTLLFDPMDGWWMLNFGRNLVYPTEAFYHGLFLTAMLMLLRRRFRWAIVLSALLSAANPCAGFDLAAILAAYAFVELISGSGRAYATLFAGGIAIAILHALYYLVFLRSFPSHRETFSQEPSDWPYLAWTYVPVLYLVGFLAVVRFSRWKQARELWAQPSTRLFAVWFVTVFAITQHDLIVKPIQPIHFARGYDWMALFFLAAPAILVLIEKALALRRPIARVAALSLLLTVFLFDNLTWFWSFHDPSAQRQIINLTPGERGVLDWLRDHAEPPSIVVADDSQLNHLISTYTEVRSWLGHDFSTPQVDLHRRQIQAAFSENRSIPTGRPTFYVPHLRLAWHPPDGARQVYANSEFVIWQVP